MQYTIRNVPDYLDAALRSAAREQGKSLNEAMLEALARGTGMGNTPCRKRDVSDIVGTWVEDPGFDAALAELDTIDEAIWR
jgi:hypothetical protein